MVSKQMLTVFIPKSSADENIYDDQQAIQNDLP